MKSRAPRRMASTASSTEPHAVITITGRVESRLWMRLSRSSPSCPEVALAAGQWTGGHQINFAYGGDPANAVPAVAVDNVWVNELLDRKSTRLNSSHLGISYAVF